MKAVVAAFNQEKALVGAFSVIVQLHRLIDLRHYQSQRAAGHVTPTLTLIGCRKGKRNPEYTRDLIVKKLTDDDDGIATTNLKVTVSCPLGEEMVGNIQHSLSLL